MCPHRPRKNDHLVEPVYAALRADQAQEPAGIERGTAWLWIAAVLVLVAGVLWAAL